MKKVKTIVDRERLSSDYIGSKQNFGHVLSQVKNLKPPVWKTAWFYGPVGVAVIAITLSITSIDPIVDPPKKDKTEVQNLKAFVSTSAPTTQINREKKAESHKEKKANPAPVVRDKPAVSRPDPDRAPEPDNTVVNNTVEEKDEIDLVVKKRTPVESKPVRKRKNMLPHIGGNYMGDIPSRIICSETGIECNDEIRVVAFNIQFYNGEKQELTKVVGNKIPHEVCEKIRKFNLNDMIFITAIKGVNTDGKIVNLTSLNFIATP